MRTAGGIGAGLAEMVGELIGAVRRKWRPFQFAVRLMPAFALSGSVSISVQRAPAAVPQL